MDHEEATRIHACSRYLLGDLSAGEAAAFEEHYFDCAECSEELKADAIFAGNVSELYRRQSREFASSVPGWLDRFRAAFSIPVAVAACLLLVVIVYQNAVMIPALRTEVAELSAPQSVPWVPLKLAREDSSFHLSKEKPFWMVYFRLPNPAEFPAYICDIQTSGGKQIKTVTLPAPPPGQPLAILLRRSEFSNGVYIFKVRGQQSPKVIESYSLDLNSN
jgi:hypothetical protein